MPYIEDDFVAISALQHLVFCPRQCALIHNEQSWAENRLTAEGRLLHKNAESGKSTTRDGIRITRDLPLHSFQWGLVGKADIVEFHSPPDINNASVTRALRKLAREQQDLSLTGWRIHPVEYKRGKPKQDHSDRVQICAQALCLEEMLDVEIENGSLFYGQKQHRTEVRFDSNIRQLTTQTILNLHKLIASGHTPSASFEPKCTSCSLYDLCLPKSFQRKSASRWLKNNLNNESIN